MFKPPFNHSLIIIISTNFVGIFYLDKIHKIPIYRRNFWYFYCLFGFHWYFFIMNSLILSMKFILLFIWMELIVLQMKLILIYIRMETITIFIKISISLNSSIFCFTWFKSIIFNICKILDIFDISSKSWMIRKSSC